MGIAHRVTPCECHTAIVYIKLDDLIKIMKLAMKKN